MENLFKKFFKSEARLASTEWPPPEPQTETEDEIIKRLEGLRKRLGDLNSQKDMNDWTVEDRQQTKLLEDEIAALEQKLEGDSPKKEMESIVNQSEDPDVKRRLDEFMKKVRG